MFCKIFRLRPISLIHTVSLVCLFSLIPMLSGAQEPPLKGWQKLMHDLKKPSAEQELARLEKVAKDRFELEKSRLSQECAKLEEFSLTVGINSGESVLKQLGRPSSRSVVDDMQLFTYACQQVFPAIINLAMVRSRADRTDEELTRPRSEPLFTFVKRLFVVTSDGRIIKTQFGYLSKSADEDIRVKLVR
jgi:hypothetical protein